MMYGFIFVNRRAKVYNKVFAASCIPIRHINSEGVRRCVSDNAHRRFYQHRLPLRGDKKCEQRL